MIGTSMGSLTNLESLSTPVTPPKSTFSQYAELVGLGSGGTRGVGLPIASWRWGFIHRAERDELRTFCPGASAVVYIRTYTKETSDVTAYYRATVHWPVLEEEVDASRRIGFVLNFTDMILQAPP